MNVPHRRAVLLKWAGMECSQLHLRLSGWGRCTFTSFGHDGITFVVLCVEKTSTWESKQTSDFIFSVNNMKRIQHSHNGGASKSSKSTFYLCVLSKSWPDYQWRLCLCAWKMGQVVEADGWTLRQRLILWGAKLSLTWLAWLTFVCCPSSPVPSQWGADVFIRGDTKPWFSK